MTLSRTRRSGVEPRTLWTCATPGCEVVGTFTTEPDLHCSMCLADLVGVYDATGKLVAQEDR